ncbi:MAG: hypothetical protein GF350_15430 [Chitinivibrionales bacterium]|nr:hypothetical protein [Chitinivibrionales bacterium]
MKRVLSPLLYLLALALISGCLENPAETEDIISSRSYKGHESDADANNFVTACPQALNTRLDDCILCHTGGDMPNSKGGLTPINACDYCHYLARVDSSLSLSLNSYGTAYYNAGRSIDAVKSIGDLDSDGDSYTNAQEISANYFPGNAQSNPDKPACPFIEITLAELQAMPAHSQFLLVNAHKQQYDDYATYTGVKISVLLEQLGIDTAGATGITVFAPDGYAKTFSLNQACMEYPKSIYYAGFDDEGLGQDNGFVSYPDSMPYITLQSGDTIPDNQYMLLAYERDFAAISTSYLDLVEMRIQGEGPFRLVRPQNQATLPDRGSKYLEGHTDYLCDETYDHNAGDMVRGVTIIRIDPMPAEYEEFDTMNAGWSYLEAKNLVVYGHGVN